MHTYEHGTATVTVLTDDREARVHATFCDLMEVGYSRHASVRMAFARWNITPSSMPDLRTFLNNAGQS